MQWDKKQVSVLATVAMTSFMGTFLISSINIALPTIAKNLSLDSVSLSWVITAFLLSSALFLLPVGRWGDLTGIRRLFKAGLIIFTVSSLLCSLVNSGSWLIALRFLQGIGVAFTSTTGQAILVSAFPPKFRGRVLGISVAAVYVGLSIGPFVGGYLTQTIGWKSIFLATAFFGLVSTIVAFLFLEKDEIVKEGGRKINLKGIGFYMAGLVALVYGSSQIPGAAGWTIMAAGIPAFILFWYFESRSALPVIDTKLFTHNRLFAYSNLAAFINYSATSAIVFLLSLYLQKVRGFTPHEAGTILVAQPIMMALFSPLVGRLSDRIQPRYLATGGMAMCSLGLLTFAFFGSETSIPMIVGVLLWVGLGFALFSSPNMNTIMSSVDRTQLGVASGTAASMRILGQIISMTIITLFFAGMFGRQAIAEVPDPLFLDVMKWGFITFSTFGLAGVYFSYNRGKMQHEEIHGSGK